MEKKKQGKYSSPTLRRFGQSHETLNCVCADGSDACDKMPDGCSAGVMVNEEWCAEGADEPGVDRGMCNRGIGAKSDSLSCSGGLRAQGTAADTCAVGNAPTGDVTS